MIPILYPAGERDFQDNGLGKLSDAISCTVDTERTGVFELTMEYPMEGIHYADLQSRRIILAKPDALSDPQPFRIYEFSRPMGGTVTVYAKHVAYDLQGIPVKPFTAGSCTAALQGLKNNAAVVCPFEFWTDKTTKADMTVSVPTAIWSLLGGSQGGILDVYGGEYEFDRWTVKLHKQRGYDRGVTIRYGKNLTDLQQEEKCSSVYTGVYPYWASAEGELMELSQRVLNAEGSYSFTRILPLDLSQEWQEKPTEAQLKARAEKYMKDNKIGVPKISLDVSFAALEQTEEYRDRKLLEQVGICDTVTVEFPKLGVSATAECIKTSYDTLRERYDSITIGEARSSFAKAMADVEASLEDRPTDTYLRQAITGMTEAMLGAKGGAVRLTDSDGDGMPDAIYIADNPDLDKAQHVWLFNHAGWGASKTGKNGPFVMGATLNGGLTADFITGGTINANLIRAGSIEDVEGLNRWDLASGAFSISGKFSTYDAPDGKERRLTGYIGYMEGQGGGQTTHGIGVSNGAGDCYAIATDAGARLQAGHYSIYVTKNGSAAIEGKDNSIFLSANGDNGSGIYLTGSLWRRPNSSSEWEGL